MSNGQSITAAIAGALAVAAVAVGTTGCGDDESEAAPADFGAADLERLNLSANDVPEMEYRANASGAGAFAAEQREQAKEGDRGGLELVTELETLGLEDDYVAQFEAASRDADVFFVESVAFLFEDGDAAKAAVPVISEANTDSLDSARPMDTQDLGEEPFAIRGEFDGYLTYSFGWRSSDVIQVVTVAPADQKAGPGATLDLAEQLAAKAQS